MRDKMHNACAAADLALPIRNKWKPAATMLLMTPKTKPGVPALAAEEDDAIGMIEI